MRDEVLPPDGPAEATRTAWETEHLDDPRDDAGTYVEVTIPPAPTLDAAEWRSMAEGYRRERDRWRDEADRLRYQIDRLEDDRADLLRMMGGGR